MHILTLDGVACSTPDGAPLFSNLTLSLDRDIVGLVGRNGAGKTSLLEAIMGDRPIAAGTITRHGRIGLLRQRPDADARSIADLLGVAEDVARLDRIERGDATDQDHGEADWTLPARIADALTDAGLPALDLQRPLATLSGGERTRVMLAGLLLPGFDMLLLDEPTNNLDDDGRAAVIDLLARWRGGALIASHDRALLQSMDRIVELTRTGVHVVGGGWDAFDAQRTAERARAEQSLRRTESDLAQARRDRQQETEKQDRRDKRGRAAAAASADPRILLSRQKQRAEQTAGRYRTVGNDLIDRADEAHGIARDQVEKVTPIRITLPPSGLSSRHMLVEAQSLCCDRDRRRLFGPLDLTMRGPERIALTGANGSGKTSLIRLILGLDAPSSGTITADRPRIALLDQHLALLDGAATLADAVLRHNPAMTRHAMHAALAAYGFRNLWADRAVSGLSGGERVRLALACLFAQPLTPQMLILDEPTNHLDVAAMELLEAALRDYDGALLCVSHDSGFRAALNLSRTITLRPTR
ncbi:MAG: ABC-F family ATP-binding cassette domain-containing protein [Sphingomonadaceae bacterium]|nr:ABC-F family ATP-binding cassette domain-containing protein [Sphingomonadaceae bacterium]